MKPKPLSLPEGQILVNTRLLTDRWGINQRTVIRLCRYHGLSEIQMVPKGRLLFFAEEISELERKLFGWN